MSSRDEISKETMINKVVRTLLPLYSIRVPTIQELRSTPSNDLTLVSLVGRLTTFELANFDNYSLTNVESSLKKKLTLDGSRKGKKRKHVNIDSESNEELDELEALLARRLPRGKGKYKCKFLLYVLHVINLVILLQGVLIEKIRMRGRTIGTKTKEIGDIEEIS